ncbi:hypothetical protein [Roseivirga sp. E12]|uniref:hypothetical protein n=1 Tax=Roseivirga sp. E12 TaxID=2819237 RepID=UPI001ABCDE54|nr:hypothetical protein [Roseivirga sp. E12]MBO3699845.1 hypothetical protein [Roseivirga sp. E12]
MWSKIRISLALISSLFLFNEASAQYDQSSYSIIGLGTVNWGGYSHNAAMGGLGVSYGDRLFLSNGLNPALGAINLEAVFQMGGSLDIRQYTQGQTVHNTTTGGFKDFGLNLPIKLGKWNMGLSLSPYSAVNYGFINRNEGGGPEGSTTVVEVGGTGGIDKLSLTNSFKLNNLLIGIDAQFLFGSIQKEDLFFLEGLSQAGFGNTVVARRQSFHNLSLGVGAVYQLPLAERTKLNIGGFYHPEIKVRQNTLTTFENQTQSGVAFSTDTLVFDEADKKTVLVPQKFGFGISYEKTRALTIGLDFLSQDWSSYRDEDGAAETAYGNSYRLALGGTFVPDYESRKLLSLTTFRFGVHYEQTPFLVNNETIDDIGLSLGASFPLNAVWGQAHINLGATIGRRGSVSNSLVRENYFKVHLGFSLQDVTWFTRQRFN